MTFEVPFRPLLVDQSDVRYAYGPDSFRQPGVPSGRTVEFVWNDSVVYPGTSRRFWVHLPVRYDPAQPASLMVFLDGGWYLDPAGEVRGVTVGLDHYQVRRYDAWYRHMTLAMWAHAYLAVTAARTKGGTRTRS